MRIAVLSGKGGTGKTLVSVNLAAAAGKTTYIDCDVEEPNGHLFFRPRDVQFREVVVKIPHVDSDCCIGCRKCVEFCNFNSLAYINKKLKVFEDICHSCGGCVLLCPQQALTEKDKIIGRVQAGMAGDVQVLTGILNPGEASGIPIIQELLRRDINAESCFIDCPPGSACIVMESIKDADYCILVAEPTVFGVHNLSMVCELVRLFDKPHGVVLNKCLPGENPAEKYCREQNLEVLAAIPFDSELGTLNSNAGIAVEESNRYKTVFMNLLDTVVGEVRT